MSSRKSWDPPAPQESRNLCGSQNVAIIKWEKSSLFGGSRVGPVTLTQHS
jgi:hypothetical protein